MEIKSKTSTRWQDFLPRALGASVDRFKNTEITFDFDLDNAWQVPAFKKDFRSEKGKILFSAEKTGNSSVVQLVAVSDDKSREFPSFVLEDFVSQALLEAVLAPYLPEVFMVSTERTGAVIFKEELNLTKNKIVNYLSTMDANKHDLHPAKLFEAIYKDGYPLPVEHNVQFVNRFGSLEGFSSGLLEQHPALSADFEAIAGGRYETNKNGVTHFVPKGTTTRLRLSEASSAARSLVVIWYWLKAQAAVGQMLLVDEPELNLHPENQRVFARFLAKLVNLGVKVLITTHSDTMLREFNTLIMLARDLPHVQAVRERHGYGHNEYLSTEKIRLYVANGKAKSVAGRVKKGALSTLECFTPDEKLGFSAEIFDSTITDMNNMQDALRYGAV